MKENDIIAGSYKILNRIGQGGTGTIFLGYHLHLQKYIVLKETRLAAGDENMIRAEADILKNLHHQYLPQVYDFLIDGGKVITVLDYVEGNDLSKYPCGPRNLSEEVLLKWLGQMAEVLDYLHGQRVPIIHSDIKPGNVIVRPNGDVCLIDFNISMVVNDLSRIRGYSAQFASPEQFYLAQTVAAGRDPGYRLDPSTDIYSTGALFYYLMTGRELNCAAPVMPLREMGDIGYSSALINIVDKCLQWDRSGRYRDGGELRRAVRYYWKQDDRYKKMLVVRALCVMLGAAAVTGGVFGVLRWRENAVRESYREGYAEVSEKLRTGDDPGAEKAAVDILGEERYGSFLRKNPKDHAELLHALGDVSYNRGDYESASSYYLQALETAAEAKTDLAVYYRDYAIALARNGKVAEAREILRTARDKNINETMLRLVEISCAYMDGQYADCITLAEEMEKDPAADEDSVARAEYFGGLAEGKLGNNPGKAEWLAKASGGGNIVYLKALADTYWEMAGDNSIPETEQKLHALKACEIYKTLCSDYYPTYENLLNLAIIQYYLQEYTESQLTLEQCTEKYPSKYSEDYHISMYKAFLYEETGNHDRAADEARNALGIIDRSGETILNNHEAEAVYRLRSIGG